MKTVLSIFIISLLFLVACTPEPQMSIVKPNTTEIAGELGKYFEIVDQNYEMTPYETQGYLGHQINIEIKRKATEINFSTDSLIWSGPNRTTIYMDILKSNGQPANNFKEYSPDDLEIKKLLNTPINQTAWIKLQTTYGRKIEKVPPLEANFILKPYSNLQFKKPIISYNTPNNKKDKLAINTKSSGDWDKILTQYEQYTKQYLTLIDEISELSKSTDEYSIKKLTEVTNKSQSLQLKAIDLAKELQNADGMTSEQLNRFTSIQNKFNNSILLMANK